MGDLNEEPPIREEPLPSTSSGINLRRTVSQRWPHTSRLTNPVINIGVNPEVESRRSNEPESIRIVNQDRFPYFEEDYIDREAEERDERHRIAAMQQLGAGYVEPPPVVPVHELSFERLRQLDFEGLMDGYTFRRSRLNGLTRIKYTDERFARFMRNTMGQLRMSDIGNPPDHVHLIRDRSEVEEEVD